MISLLELRFVMHRVWLDEKRIYLLEAIRKTKDTCGWRITIYG